MKSIEVCAKTVDDAITQAAISLEVSSDQLNIEILDEGKKALGLFGRSAKIKATLYTDEEKKELEKAAKKAEHDKQEQAKKESDKKEACKKEPFKKEAVKKETPHKELSSKETEAHFEPKEFVTATGAVVSVDDSIEKRIREAKANGSSKNKKNSATAKPDMEPVYYDIPADADAVCRELCDFLKNVLDAMGVQNKIEAHFNKEGILTAEITAPDGTDDGMGVVIGKRASTLDSLQYLATLVLNKNRNDHLHIKLDTAGYRMRREQTLAKLALSIASNVRRNNRQVALEPMNPYERRVIHTALQNEKGIETFSEGEEPYRRVIIAPARHRH